MTTLSISRLDRWAIGTGAGGCAAGFLFERGGAWLPFPASITVGVLAILLAAVFLILMLVSTYLEVRHYLAHRSGHRSKPPD